MPDLYPNDQFHGTSFKHNSLIDLKILTCNLVKKSLEDTFNCNQTYISSAMERLFPTAFVHDAEMLLLAASNRLCEYVGSSDLRRTWKAVVEDQNQQNPPKKIINDIFRTKSRFKRAYKETKDAPAILKRVQSIKDEILYDDSRNLKCPEFKDVLDWISRVTNISF
jgi:hypothetical protein